MSFDNNELKVIKRYLALILNNPDYLIWINGRNYIDVADLKRDVEYINDVIRGDHEQ